MRSSIRDFWSTLGESVHDEDKAVLLSHPHTFNLDFPPPAFIGDVDHAPVVILMANGGLDPALKENEFPTLEDEHDYMSCLTGDRPGLPRRLAMYYRSLNFFHWVQRGAAVIVNEVAYRSPSIGQEPWNRKIADFLPSTAVHRRWLANEVVPDVRAGKRMVVAHRAGLWKIVNRPELERFPGFLFREVSLGKHMTRESLARVDKWLTTRNWNTVQ